MFAAAKELHKTGYFGKAVAAGETSPAVFCLGMQIRLPAGSEFVNRHRPLLRLIAAATLVKNHADRSAPDVASRTDALL